MESGAILILDSLNLTNGAFPNDDFYHNWLNNTFGYYVDLGFGSWPSLVVEPNGTVRCSYALNPILPLASAILEAVVPNAHQHELKAAEMHSESPNVAVCAALCDEQQHTVFPPRCGLQLHQCCTPPPQPLSLLCAWRWIRVAR